MSPRYARQVAAKLSVFWPIAAAGGAGRKSRIRGILNALDMKDSLAALGLPLEEALARKRAAKAALQARYGLEAGERFDLFVFMGRITQQKGCDIIAEVRRV